MTDSTIARGTVGLVDLPTGAESSIRLDRTKALVVSIGHAPYQEATVSGRVFTMDSDAVTLAAANATKSALATVKLINGFFNPLTSGKNAVIIAAHVATTSGTPGGPYLWNTISGVTVNSAATGTIRSGLVGSSAYSSSMTAQTGVVVTVIGGATTNLTQYGVMGGPAAIAAGAGLYDAYEEVGGRIVVPPGTLFGLTCAAAGTSHVVQTSITWEEVPV